MGALFVGGSGLGKTHLARALGYAQCQRGRRVLYTTLAALVNRLTAAEATKTLHAALASYQAPGVLLVDELGYVALRQPESHLFFQVISARHDRRRPTVITTNRAFGEWNQVFPDDAVAHAILDRLAERAEVFHLEGTSYRETHRRPAPRAPQP
jgi:DNA replication protein DnaC